MSTDKCSLRPRPGAEIRMVLHMPLVEKCRGVVVLVPGQGYHMNMPLIRRSAEALCEAGINAARFDWAYLRGGTKPSPSLDDEASDLAAAIEHARERIGTNRVLLVGKSLGCIVAAQHARNDSIEGVAMLTPPLHERDNPARKFPGSEHLPRLSALQMIVAGDRDPLCHLAALAGFVARSPASTRVLIVPGDHTLEAASASETNASLETVTRWLLVWAFDAL